MALQFCRPTAQHVNELAASLSTADRAELAAGGCADALEAIAEGVRISPWAVAVLEDQAVLCIFGVAPLRPHLLLENVGVPWLLGTDAMRRHRRKLISGPTAYIGLMLETYPHLVNTVHAENRRAVRWLQRLGFAVDAATPCGPGGALFHRFTMNQEGAGHV